MCASLFVIGMFGIGLMAVFMGIGVDQGSATIGSIVVGLEPIGVALAGVLLVGDAPSRRSIIALIVGFTGAIVASGVFTEHSGPSPVVPIILLLGTVVAFSVYTAFVRRVGRGVDPLAVAAVTQVGALFFVIPACLFDVANGGMLRGDSITPKAFGAVIFLGIGSGIAYLLLCLVLSNQPSNRVAVTLFLTPLIGVIVSWLVVGEHLHWRDGVGGALVLAGGVDQRASGSSDPASGRPARRDLERATAFYTRLSATADRHVRSAGSRVLPLGDTRLLLERGARRDDLPPRRRRSRDVERLSPMVSPSPTSRT